MTTDSPTLKLDETTAFCLAPWVLFHVQTTGNVAPCCVAGGSFGNVKYQTVDEIWNGASIRDFRTRMLRGESMPACRVCHLKERTGNRSLRQIINAGHAEKMPWVESTAEDGSSVDSRPVTWDVRLSNVCNFRCRSCFHGASSGWFEEARKLKYQVAPQAVIRAVVDPQAILAQLEPLVPHVEEVYFAGGEPLIMEEHYRILDLLVAHQRFDVKLVYDTNFSLLHYKNVDVLDLWSRFPNIEVSASVDGSRERGEYLRKGQSWPQLLENRHRLEERCPHVRFSVRATVSALNVLHLPDLHRELVDTEFVEMDRFIINIVVYPRTYDMRILPARLKKQARRLFEEHTAWIRRRGSDLELDSTTVDRVVDRFDNCLRHLESADTSRFMRGFQRHTLRLDHMRQESVTTVFPELAELFTPRARLCAVWPAAWGKLMRQPRD